MVPSESLYDISCVNEARKVLPEREGLRLTSPKKNKRPSGGNTAGTRTVFAFSNHFSIRPARSIDLQVPSPSLYRTRIFPEAIMATFTLMKHPRRHSVSSLMELRSDYAKLSANIYILEGTVKHLRSSLCDSEDLRLQNRQGYLDSMKESWRLKKQLALVKEECEIRARNEELLQYRIHLLETMMGLKAEAQLPTAAPDLLKGTPAAASSTITTTTTSSGKMSPDSSRISELNLDDLTGVSTNCDTSASSSIQSASCARAVRAVSSITTSCGPISSDINSPVCSPFISELDASYDEEDECRDIDTEPLVHPEELKLGSEDGKALGPDSGHGGEPRDVDGAAAAAAASHPSAQTSLEMPVATTPASQKIGPLTLTFVSWMLQPLPRVPA